MVRHTLSLIGLLSLFWLANSGYSNFNTLVLSLGLISVILVLIVSHRMDLIDHESQPLHLSYRMPAYFIWLIKQIILSNIEVVHCIWSFKLPITPSIITIRASQKTVIAKVIYANSITLTPGTVTLNITNNELTVHALTSKSVLFLKSGVMDRKVTTLEK
jgi:multicomponent Na+:H+ antiporter subunit E